eukprot:TRINITY_DN600_c0_g1_i1.p1 TRINITY_DN600_c0_g1~~TRINITY_DN600_c0_g1_i1.p1  ORF type:complete len:1129 (-),score=41.58 TRINITY_DN600_c0_g1_i1:946-4044(-)
MLEQDGHRIVPLARRAFNDNEGLLLVKRLGLPPASPSVAIRDPHVMISSSQHELEKAGYLSLAAVGALLRYAETLLGLALMPMSLSIQVHSLSGHMAVDVQTLRQLQVIPTFGAATTTTFADDKRCSLFGILDHTKSLVGRRLLRAALLSPLADAGALSTRYNAVEFLLENSAFIVNLQSALNSVATAGSTGRAANLDAAIGVFAVTSNRPSISRACHTITHLMVLQDFLKALPALLEVLELVVGPVSLPSDEGGASGSCSSVRLRQPSVRQAPETALACSSECTLTSRPSPDAVALFHKLHALLCSEAVQAVLRMLGRVLDPEVRCPLSASGQDGALAETQLLHAVKVGINPLLDVSRRNCVTTIEDVHAHAVELRSQFGLSSINVRFHIASGFYFDVPTSRAPAKRSRGALPAADDACTTAGTAAADLHHADASQLRDSARQPDTSVPSEHQSCTTQSVSAASLPKDVFLRQVKRGSFVQFLTETLIVLNNRFKTCFTEVLTLSDEVVQGVLDEVRSSSVLPHLHVLSESIAFLDFLQSLATYARLGNADLHVPFIRPTLSPHSTVFRNVFHPILLSHLRPPRLIPCSIALSVGRNFVVLSGPNMSGKTTVLVTLGLAVILAHIGSFVPAEVASVRVTQSLLTRLDFCDSIEASASTLTVELAGASHILERASPTSLILCDELGRGTHFVDGAALAWAFCEKLLSVRSARGAFTVFVSHFPVLAQLSHRWCGVVNRHLSVTACESAAASGVPIGAANSPDVSPVAPAPDTASGSSSSRDGLPTLQFHYQVSDGPCEVASYGIALAKLVGFPDDLLRRAVHVSRLVVQPSRMSSPSTFPAHFPAIYDVAQKLLMIAADGELEPAVIRPYIMQLKSRLAALPAVFEATAPFAPGPAHSGQVHRETRQPVQQLPSYPPAVHAAEGSIRHIATSGPVTHTCAIPPRIAAAPQDGAASRPPGALAQGRSGYEDGAESFGMSECEDQQGDQARAFPAPRDDTGECLADDVSSPANSVSAWGKAKCSRRDASFTLDL